MTPQPNGTYTGVIKGTVDGKPKKVADEKTENCKCGSPGLPAHPCPFREEIYGKNDLCNCCAGCIKGCARDI